MLSLQHIRERFKRTVSGASYWTTATTVIKERIYRFLQHTLLIVNDDFWCAKISKPLQSIISIDYSTIEIV